MKRLTPNQQALKHTGKTYQDQFNSRHTTDKTETDKDENQPVSPPFQDAESKHSVQMVRNKSRKDTKRKKGDGGKGKNESKIRSENFRSGSTISRAGGEER